MQEMARRTEEECRMSDTLPSNEKVADFLRRWYCLKGEPRFREAADEIERLERELEDARAQLVIVEKERQWAQDRAMRAAHEPADDLYALLVRRGYTQHEAHAIAFGDKLAVLSSSPPPPGQLKNAPENFNTADGVKADGYQPDQEWMNAGLGEYSTQPPCEGPTQFEQARDAVAEVVRTLGGEARIGATLALQAIVNAMEGTRASQPPSADDLVSLSMLIGSDKIAITYQSMAQYRTMLLKAIQEMIDKSTAPTKGAG
jgi:hypothetical protein